MVSAGGTLSILIVSVRGADWRPAWSTTSVVSVWVPSPVTLTVAPGAPLPGVPSSVQSMCPMLELASVPVMATFTAAVCQPLESVVVLAGVVVSTWTVSSTQFVASPPASTARWLSVCVPSWPIGTVAPTAAVCTPPQSIMYSMCWAPVAFSCTAMGALCQPVGGAVVVSTAPGDVPGVLSHDDRALITVIEPHDAMACAGRARLSAASRHGRSTDVRIRGFTSRVIGRFGRNLQSGRFPAFILGARCPSRSPSWPVGAAAGWARRRRSCRSAARR